MSSIAIGSIENSLNLTDLNIKLSDLKPLDIGLIGGSDVISLFIRGIEKVGMGVGNYSHIFIVITTEVLNLPAMIPDKLYLLEVTLSGSFNDGIKDIYGRTHFGVQIRDLEVVCKAQICMGSKIYFSKLLNSPFRRGFTLKNDGFLSIKDINAYKKMLSENMMKIYLEYVNRGYNFNFKSLLKPVFANLGIGKYKKIKEYQESGVFCSEFVAIVFNKLGILSINDPEILAPVSIIDKKDITGITKLFTHPLPLYYKVII